jgi:hypothetical protein
MSSDSASDRTSRGSGSHSSSLSSVPQFVRYNPISVAAVTRPGRERKRRSSKHDDFSDKTSPWPAAPLERGVSHLSITKCTIYFLLSYCSRREEIHRQRIESRQRRRDELRDGYRRLKDAFISPASFVMVLRLFRVNEALMLGTAEQRHAAVAAVQQQQSSF